MIRLITQTTLASFAIGSALWAADPAPLSFTAEGKEFHFNTGALQGTLHADGKSVGLRPLTDVATGTVIAGSKKPGLFSHYRLLDAGARYGHAGWEWASEARLTVDGAVEVNWKSDAEHPFEMQATYRWKNPTTLDLVTRVTARRELKKMEVFLASYFEGFDKSFGYVKNGAEAKFVAAEKSAGVWQAFPRDDEAARLVRDGRWQRPPNPVEWAILPPFAGALGMRRDSASGLTALVMAPPQDCFAALMPFGEEGHRSLYLSLFGRDFKEGETAAARARLVIGSEISDQQAAGLYSAFVGESAAAAK